MPRPASADTAAAAVGSGWSRTAMKPSASSPPATHTTVSPSARAAAVSLP